MSPNGRTFATVSADGTTVVWDLRRLADSALSADADVLWTDLAKPDAVRGRQAIEALIAMRAKAVGLLRERLRPVPAPDAKQLARWIAALDSDDFDTRDQAGRALDRLGELAGPALRQRLATRPPLETRRRIDGLLAKLDAAAALSGDQLRAVRAVQVLEGIADSAARQLLDALARGAAARG